ncbi:MAG: hypothetical protein JWR26_1356 [Pedosphaera sp.]|nr:hypothetical protein [Pedosphaera sp.]
MKNNQVIVVLVVLLFLMLASTAFLVHRYTSSITRLQELQTRAGLINNTRIFTQSLFTDATEYSKKNPAILPILQAATNSAAEAAMSAAAPKTSK